MELERFREPNGDTSEGYTSYYVPNGNGYMFKKQSRKPQCGRYVSCTLNVLLFLLALIFILMYVLSTCPNCECVVKNGHSHGNEESHYYSLSTNGVSNGKYITSTSQYDDDLQTYPTDEANTTPAVIGSSHDENVSSEEEPFYLLPGDLQPVSYSIMLIPDFLKDMTTIGNISITFNCFMDTNEITLNARDLTIDKSSIIVTMLKDKSLFEIQSVDMIKDSEMLKIHLRDFLQKNNTYNVEIKFTGLIQDFPKGLYRTEYSLKDQKGYMVNTLFSPNDARSVFPCFDEPMYKARFTFTLGRQQEYNTISNMNRDHTYKKNLNGTTYWMDVFHQTPPMSTYLTAFAISEFQAIQQNSYNISFAAHSEGSDLKQMYYILQWMDQLTYFFGRYFGISYPLPKMDLIAVPEQFFIAMENWGLITFRKNLAYANESTTEDDKQHVILTLAHEIAHQWFGNLVTPKWWDNLWLKEGFSTYFGYLAVNEVKPEWGVNEKFQVEVLDRAFKIDAHSVSIPLSRSVSKTSAEIFESMSYDKGAAVINMMAHFLGSDNFKRSIISYLKRFEFSNANQDDLWQVFEENLNRSYTRDIDLRKVMESWTTQIGYPVVHVTLNNKSISFRQERLLMNGESQNDSQWWIPISYTTQRDRDFNNTQPKFWLTSPMEVKINESPGWIIANLNQNGYYRVNYDIHTWEMLLNEFQTFPKHIKAQLISDCLFLAQASKVDYDLALSMTLEMTKETDYLLWKAVSNHIFYIGNLINNMPAYGNFRLFMLRLMSRVYSDYDNTAKWREHLDDSVSQAHLVNIINMACHFDRSECLQSSYNLFLEQMVDKVATIPNYIKHVVYCSAVKIGGERVWEITYNVLKNTTSTEERRRLVHALGCSNEAWLQTKSLTILLSQDHVALDMEESMILFESVMSNPVGNQIGASFLRDQWSFILKRYKSPTLLYKMVTYLSTFVNTPYHVSELKVLIDKIQNSTMEKSVLLRQTIEDAENNVIWMKKHYSTLSPFLDLFRDNYGIIGRN